jgi:hypothetical protein
MGAKLTHFAFLVAGRIDDKGFFRHVEVAASSLEEAQSLAARAIADEGGEVEGFDDVENRGIAAATQPGVTAATGFALYSLAES